MTGTDQTKYALDEASNNQGYVLGRVCALLEEVEVAATNCKGHIVRGRTAKVCQSPALWHPQQFAACQPHFAILEHRNPWMRRYYHDEVCRLMSSIPMISPGPIPTQLSQEDQGNFWLGYHHQCWSLRRRTSEKQAK